MGGGGRAATTHLYEEDSWGRLASPQPSPLHQGRLLGQRGPQGIDAGAVAALLAKGGELMLLLGQLGAGGVEVAGRAASGAGHQLSADRAGGAVLDGADSAQGHLLVQVGA